MPGATSACNLGRDRQARQKIRLFSSFPPYGDVQTGENLPPPPPCASNAVEGFRASMGAVSAESAEVPALFACFTPCQSRRGHGKTASAQSVMFFMQKNV